MELGSEYSLNLFELNIKENDLTALLSEHERVCYTDSGRSSIRYISAKIPKHTGVLLPEYICESVINCFSRNNISFYKLKDNYEIDCSDLSAKMSSTVKVIFLMHYFGSLQPEGTLEFIKELAEKNDCMIIEDVTHSLFSAVHSVGDYVIASVRKWVPIPKGGIIIVKNDVLRIWPIDLVSSSDNDRLYGMILKDLFLRGKMECNSEYRQIFRECEDRLDNSEKIEGISDLSRFILQCIDTRELISRRKNNYRHLKERLVPMGLTPVNDIKEQECPFVYPVRVPDRDAFRSYLIDNRIYCAVHWPFDCFMAEERPMAVRDSSQLLSLPIDQRYSQEHMDYLVKVISDYRGELSF